MHIKIDRELLKSLVGVVTSAFTHSTTTAAVLAEQSKNLKDDDETITALKASTADLNDKLATAQAALANLQSQVEAEHADTKDLAEDPELSAAISGVVTADAPAAPADSSAPTGTTTPPVSTSPEGGTDASPAADAPAAS